ncbi:MAG: DUF5317 domain-containing protein [Bacillota bacterium]
MLVTFAAGSFILSWLLGGKPKRLADLDFQRLPWMMASFLLRDIAEELFDKAAPELWASTLLALACYGLLFYGIYPNRRLPGMWAVALGSALNLLVILANQARMPVSVARLTAEEAAREIARLGTSINHQLLVPTSRLQSLADLYKWTFLQPQPVMFSIGDVLITAGVSYLIFKVSLRGFRPSAVDGRMGKVG